MAAAKPLREVFREASSNVLPLKRQPGANVNKKLSALRNRVAAVHRLPDAHAILPTSVQALSLSYGKQSKVHISSRLFAKKQLPTIIYHNPTVQVQAIVASARSKTSVDPSLTLTFRDGKTLIIPVKDKLPSEILSTLQRAAENPAEHKAEQAPYKPQKQEVGQGEAEGGEGAEDAIAIEGKEEKEDIGLDGMPLKPGNKGEASEGPGI